MSDYQKKEVDFNTENVITIRDGKWAGVQYIIRNIKCIDPTPEGNCISFEYDLISDLGNDRNEFELWFHNYIQKFLNEIMREYINKDTD